MKAKSILLYNGTFKFAAVYHSNRDFFAAGALTQMIFHKHGKLGTTFASNVNLCCRLT